MADNQGHAESKTTTTTTNSPNRKAIRDAKLISIKQVHSALSIQARFRGILIRKRISKVLASTTMSEQEKKAAVGALVLGTFANKAQFVIGTPVEVQKPVVLDGMTKDVYCPGKIAAVCGVEYSGCYDIVYNDGTREERVPGIRIRLLDTLAQPVPVEATVVVANPPPPQGGGSLLCCTMCCAGCCATTMMLLQCLCCICNIASCLNGGPQIAIPESQANNTTVHTTASIIPAGSQRGSWLDGQACNIPAIPGHHLQIEKATFASMDVTKQVQLMVQQQGSCSLFIAAGDSHNFTQHFGDPQPMVQKHLTIDYIMRPMVPPTSSTILPLTLLVLPTHPV